MEEHKIQDIKITDLILIFRCPELRWDLLALRSEPGLQLLVGNSAIFGGIDLLENIGHRTLRLAETHKFHGELQGCATRDVSACSTVAISKFRRNCESSLLANTHVQKTRTRIY
jgi:hypothetical protein